MASYRGILRNDACALEKLVSNQCNSGEIWVSEETLLAMAVRDGARKSVKQLVEK